MALVAGSATNPDAQRANYGVGGRRNGELHLALSNLKKSGSPEIAMFADFTHLAKVLHNLLKNHDRSKPHLAALYLALLTLRPAAPKSPPIADCLKEPFRPK